MLTPKQTETIKQRLIQHIEEGFPEDRKQFAKEQIMAMDSEQLEKFLIKNNLIKTEAGKENCVFCAIVAGNVRAYKVAENKKAIAVLEINPLTKGHIIVIPKNHATSEEEIKKGTQSLVKKISSLIKTKLEPNSIKIESSNILGHEILNIIPVYGGADIEKNERKQATAEELLELQKILKKKDKKTKEKENRERKKTIKKQSDLEKEKLWLPKRIP